MIAIIGGLIVAVIILVLAVKKPVIFSMGLGYTKQRPKQTAFIIAGLMVTTTVVAGAAILADSAAESFIATEGETYKHYQGYLEDFASFGEPDWAGFWADSRIEGVTSHEPFVQTRVFIQDEGHLGAMAGLQLVTEETKKEIGLEIGQNQVLLNQEFAEDGRLSEGDELIIEGSRAHNTQTLVQPLQGTITATRLPTGWVVSPDSNNVLTMDLTLPALSLTLGSNLGEFEVDVAEPDGTTNTYSFIGRGSIPVGDSVGIWQFTVRAEAVQQPFTLETEWLLGLSSGVGRFEGEMGGVMGNLPLPRYFHDGYAVGNLADFDDAKVNGYYLKIAPGANQAQLEQTIRQVADDYGINALVFIGNSDADQEAQIIRFAANLAFLSMGGLSIISGVVLIVVLMGLLVEERKRTLGTMRALGATRGDLVAMHVSEGTIYAAIAGAVGIIGGLLLAVFLLGTVEQVVGDSEEVILSPNPLAYLGAGIGSALLILAVIAFSAHRISKIDIATAIRGEEQDLRKDRKRAKVWALVWTALGALFILLGVITGKGSLEDDYYYTQTAPGLSLGVSLGVTLFAIGIAPLVSKYVGRGPGLTLVSGSLLLFTCFSFLFLEITTEWDGLSLLVRVLVIPITFGILVAYSRPLHDGVVAVATKMGGIAALWDSALSTIRNKPARNAMTIAVLGSVLMGITAMGALFATFSVEDQGDLGGYNVLVQMNEGDLAAAATSSGVEVPLDSVGEYILMETTSPYKVFESSMYTDVWQFDALLIGATESFVANTDFTFVKARSNAWGSVLAGTGVILTSTLTNDDGQAYRLGQRLDMRPGGSVEVVGLLKGTGAFSAVISEDLLGDFPDQAAFVKAYDPGYAVRVWESTFRELGAEGTDVQGAVQEEAAGERLIQTFLFSFMGLGIVIGMISLGLTTTRNVMMRRHEVGVLRAIGAKSSDVVTIFAIETGYVTSFSIVLGLVGGLGMAAAFVTGLEEFGRTLAIPWGLIAGLYGFTLMAAIVATIIPAYVASKIRPAEAVRMAE